MKILYVITGLAQGGAERVLCDLANKMFEDGHEVKIAYLTGEIQTKPSYNEIELINIDLSKPLSLPRAYLKLSNIIRQYRPDVVHAHMIHANILTRLVRLSVPMKNLICTAHNSNEGGKWRMLAYRITNSLADSTTNVSKEAVIAFESMKAVPLNEMKTIYNGIDLDRFFYDSNARNDIALELEIEKNSKIILAVARFNEQKDYPNLLKAVYLLKKEYEYSFKLIIVGDGELRPIIESIIKKLKLKNDVVLLGRRDDIPKLMSAADLFVLSSKYEGFGLVVAEAMACECLVVATDCGGVAEVINNPDFLVLPNDSIALKNKIKYVLSLSKKYKENVIRDNLKRIQENFSLKDIMKEWNDLYNE